MGNFWGERWSIPWSTSISSGASQFFEWHRRFMRGVCSRAKQQETKTENGKVIHDGFCSPWLESWFLIVESRCCFEDLWSISCGCFSFFGFLVWERGMSQVMSEKVLVTLSYPFRLPQDMSWLLRFIAPFAVQSSGHTVLFESFSSKNSGFMLYFGKDLSRVPVLRKWKKGILVCLWSHF